MLPVTASDEDIRQRYLKFSAMLHPDKCSHPGARESYEAVVAAYTKLKVCLVAWLDGRIRSRRRSASS